MPLVYVIYVYIYIYIDFLKCGGNFTINCILLYGGLALLVCSAWNDIKIHFVNYQGIGMKYDYIKGVLNYMTGLPIRS
jgi:hypothetical protein